MICTVKDNGKGFNLGDSHSLHQSKGHQLTLDRLNLLNEEYNTDAFKFEIINLTSINSTQTGTQVMIWFPLIGNWEANYFALLVNLKSNKDDTGTFNVRAILKMVLTVGFAFTVSIRAIWDRVISDS